MYYLFCPQRRAFWRQNQHGYTSRKEHAAQHSKDRITGWGYEIADSLTLGKLMSRSKSFAVHVGDADTVAVLQRTTPDVPGEVFV